MVALRRSEEFDRWLRGLKDSRGKAKILVRLDRLGLGNPGDVAAVGESVSEMRIDFGPGYRVYFKQRGEMVTILFGGDKDSQDADIKRAKEIADRLLPKQGVQDGTNATVRRG